MATSAVAQPPGDGLQSSPWLVSRAGAHLCALPLAGVVETLRPLPIEPIEGAPPFVLGLCILRGGPVPVVDVGAFFGERLRAPRRLVAIKVGGRLVALAVDEVLGLRAIPDGDMPPLLREAAGEVVDAIATLDAELLVILDAGRIVPEAVLAGLGSGETA